MNTWKNSSLLTLLTCLLIAGCTIRPAKIFTGPDAEDGAPTQRLDPNSIPDAVPRHESPSKRGNPDSYVVFGKRYHVMNSSHGFSEKGIASWYGTKFHGRLTSSGEPYDMYKMTAAHKNLPIPSYVEVTNLKNHRTTVVRVNDRGPFHDNRIIDLSYAAATKLGILNEGTGLVHIRVVQPGEAAPTPVPAPQLASAAIEIEPNPTLFLQIGAFSSRINADRLRQRLSPSLAEQIRIQAAENNGAAVYRVQVGPLRDVERVDLVTARLSDLGISDSHVVIE
jgi:rare lipoprotein A